MAVVSDEVVVTTAADGSATAYSGRIFNGRLLAISYDKVDFADGVDFTITSEGSGQTLWQESNVNASAKRYPMVQAHTTAGVAATLDGTRALLVPIPLFNERIAISVASGGDTKTGTFSFAVEGY